MGINGDFFLRQLLCMLLQFKNLATRNLFDSYSDNMLAVFFDGKGLVFGCRTSFYYSGKSYRMWSCIISMETNFNQWQVFDFNSLESESLENHFLRFVSMNYFKNSAMMARSCFPLNSFHLSFIFVVSGSQSASASASPSASVSR